MLITPGNKAIKYIKLYTYILLNTPDKEIMIQDKRKQLDTIFFYSKAATN